MEYSISSFNSMLDDLYLNLNTQNQEKLILPNLNINITTTNTFFKNAKDILRTLKCNPDHYVKYMDKELGSVNWVSGSKKDGLVIKGKVKKQKIQLLLQEYIKKYICCNICKSLNTKIIKDKKINYIYCNKCFSKTAIN